MCKDEPWESIDSGLSKNNDVIAMKVQDAWEMNPLPFGWIFANDVEELPPRLIRWDEDAVEEWKRRVEEERRRIKAASIKHNIGYVELDEGKDPLQVLRAYFEQRCGILKRR